MIEKVSLRYFKRFEAETFCLSDALILAGPNNAGKTTLLQAVAVWNLALRKWLFERGPESKSKARKRTGIPITRKEFTALPLREMNLLWTDCSTALRKDELVRDQKLGFPRILEITLQGNSGTRIWSLTFEFRYQSSEMLYAKPSDTTALTGNLEIFKDFRVVHVPPFSGIGPEETRYDQPYQDLLIGQGKPGDILRNLLREIHERADSGWPALCQEVEGIFDYQLVPPRYEGVPFILCEYLPSVRGVKEKSAISRLDISCAGSGFLQVLSLLAFLYARPASVLLLDEPDAHLHVVLQKAVYDRLREIARKRGCQLLIATHSEVLVDGTAPERILSFFPDRRPHQLVDSTERDQVREALNRLTSMDLLLAEQAPGVLYVEGETDFNLLREWARVLGHPTHGFLSKHPFWHSNRGRHPREARAHFFALKAVQPDLPGLLLLDGDNRRLPDHKLLAEGLTLARWERYESENYLVQPEALARFVKDTGPQLFTSNAAEAGLRYLKDELPRAVYEHPESTHDYLNATPASKMLLPGFFEAAGLSLTKKEYYQVAGQMRPEEIHPEVKEKLDLIAKIFELT